MSEPQFSPIKKQDVTSWGTVTPVKVDSPNGPLKELEKMKYSSTSIAYPRDIDATNKGHAVQFNIRDIKPFSTNAQEIWNKAKQIQSSIVNEVAPAASAAYKAGVIQGRTAAANRIQASESQRNFPEVVKEAEMELAGKTQGGLNAGAAAGSKAAEGVSNELLRLQKEMILEPWASVRLYMPDSLNFSYQAQYDKLSLAEAINSTPAIGKISSAVTSMLDRNVTKLISNKLGYVFNPQQQMLFEGIDFREFDLEFTLTPSSPDEAANIREIVRIFQKAAAPTRGDSMAGFYWVPPSVFDIGFFFNGEINPNVPPVLRCVLQSVTVNYAPNGWSAFADGAPVQTTMSLSFREIELLDRTAMEKMDKVNR